MAFCRLLASQTSWIFVIKSADFCEAPIAVVSLFGAVVSVLRDQSRTRISGKEHFQGREDPGSQGILAKKFDHYAENALGPPAGNRPPGQQQIRVQHQTAVGASPGVE